MSNHIPIPFLRRHAPTRRWRIALGFVIVAGLIGIGVLPARRGLVVRLAGETPRRPSRGRVQRKRRRRRRPLDMAMIARRMGLPALGRRKRR